LHFDRLVQGAGSAPPHTADHPEETMRTLIRYLAYPLTMGCSLAVVLLVLGATSTQWFAIGGVSIVGIAIVVWLERLAPFRTTWAKDQGDLGADTVHAIVNWSLLSVAAWGLHALGRLPSDIQVIDWPNWAQLLVAGGTIDLGLYVMHRVSHRVSWLWRLHAIHHSSERLYWLNGERRHPLSAIVLAAPGLIAVWMLGVPPDVTSGWLALLAVHLAFQHANVDYRLGPVRYVIAGAETHRQHHRRDYSGLQVNFGEFFVFWDILLGTFDGMGFRDNQNVGLDDEIVPSDYVAQLRWPFRPRLRAPVTPAD
jgi:sterol desaturase/sphingolipid hydroxylase (fatty acid hydroxylase superfamily)